MGLLWNQSATNEQNEVAILSMPPIIANCAEQIGKFVQHVNNPTVIAANLKIDWPHINPTYYQSYLTVSVPMTSFLTVTSP